MRKIKTPVGYFLAGVLTRTVIKLLIKRIASEVVLEMYQQEDRSK